MKNQEYWDNQVRLAEQIARKYHDGQFRNDNKTHYIVHCEQVVKFAQAAGLEKEYIAVAWLHDVIEDTDLLLGDLIQFGIDEDVAAGVYSLSKDYGSSYEFFISKIKACTNKNIRAVKICDIVANLTDSPSQKQKEKYLRALISLTF